jgi:glucokinase
MTMVGSLGAQATEPGCGTEPRLKMPIVLAVDLGGTKTSIARVDASGTLLDYLKVPAARSLDATVDQITEACNAAGSRGSVSAIGVIVPGIFTRGTGRARCPNLRGPAEVALQSALEQRLRTPIVIDSDPSGYVLGEAWLGAAKGLREVVLVSIGTGIAWAYWPAALSCVARTEQLAPRAGSR